VTYGKEGKRTWRYVKRIQLLVFEKKRKNNEEKEMVDLILPVIALIRINKLIQIQIRHLEWN
jgi:hypothetical protein